MDAPRALTRALSGDRTGDPDVRLRQAIVATVPAGPEGRCEVRLGGSPDPVVAYALTSAGTLAVDDVVWCLRAGGVVIVLGTLG